MKMKTNKQQLVILMLLVILILSQLRSYVNTHIDKSVKSQNTIEENLNHAKDLIWRLRELLNGTSQDTCYEVV
jgi:p-aminobenzoyl-glutamate transporter AbgT